MSFLKAIFIIIYQRQPTLQINNHISSQKTPKGLLPQVGQRFHLGLAKYSDYPRITYTIRFRIFWSCITQSPFNLQSYLILKRNYMNLPLINARNPKAPTKGQQLLAQSAPSLQEFGLGIQVFKIQASKGMDNHAQPRKFMKNIENPIPKQLPQPVKRTQVLPSLSCEKREKAALSQTDYMQRRTAIERKKPSAIIDTIKEVQEKQQLLKKVSNSAQKVIKKEKEAIQPPSVPQEPEIIQPHYRVSFNELTNFYAELHLNETENVKEIKRLRKMKENADEAQLQKAMRLRNCKTEMVHEMVDRQNVESFRNQQIFDEFSLSAFMDGGGRFRFEDQQIPMGSYDEEEDD